VVTQGGEKRVYVVMKKRKGKGRIIKILAGKIKKGNNRLE